MNCFKIPVCCIVSALFALLAAFDCASAEDAIEARVYKIFNDVDELEELEKLRSLEFLAALTDEELAEIYAKRAVQGGLPLELALKKVKTDRRQIVKRPGYLSDEDRRFFQQKHTEFVDELASLGPGAVPFLISWFGGRAESVRHQWLASRAIVKIGSDGVPFLLKAARSGDLQLQDKIAEALSRIGDPRAAGFFLSLLESGSGSSKRFAMEGLVELGPDIVGKQTLRTILVDTVKSPGQGAGDPTLHLAALRGIIVLGADIMAQQDLNSLLIAQLEGSGISEAIRGLHRFGEETAIAPLEVVQRHWPGGGKADLKVQAGGAINAILERAGKPKRTSPADNVHTRDLPTFDDLSLAAQCSNRAIRKMAFRWIRRFKDDRTTLFLIERANLELDPRILDDIFYTLSIVILSAKDDSETSVTPRVLQKAFDCTLTLAENASSTAARNAAISSSQTMLKVAADIDLPLEGFGRMKNLFLKLLAPEEEFSAMDYSLIGTIGAPRGAFHGGWTDEELVRLRRELYPLLDSPTPNSGLIECLGWIGENSLTPRFIELLEHEDEKVRRFSAWSLGNLGDPEALPALNTLAETDPCQSHDGKYIVRDAARRAIGKIESGQHE